MGIRIALGTVALLLFICRACNLFCVRVVGNVICWALAGGIGDGLGNKFPLPGGIADLSTLVPANEASEGTLSTENGDYIITLPLEFELLHFLNTGDESDRVDYEFSGQIVATAPVPEPSGLVLIGIGLMAFVVFCYSSRSQIVRCKRQTPS